MVKYTAIAFAAFSAIGASASASSGMADDRDAIIRDLMSKVDILSSELGEHKADLHEQKAKVKAQKAWRTELASSLKHVKAAGIAPQDKTNVRRNLRLEDEAAVEPLYYDSVVDGIILVDGILLELVEEVVKIREAVEDIHECLNYDHISSTCTLGNGSSIDSVAIRGESFV